MKKRLKTVGDHWQITFVTFNRFCLLSNPSSSLLLWTISSWMEYQANYMKNTYLFYIVSQVLMVLLIKSYMIQLPVLLFLVFLHWVLHRQIDVLQLFRTSCTIIRKKYFCHQFYFFNEFTQSPTTLHDHSLP